MKLAGIYPVASDATAQSTFLTFMATGNYPMSAQGIKDAVAAYDAVPGNPTLTVYDIGAVWGMTPAQTDVWLASNPGSYSIFSQISSVLASSGISNSATTMFTSHPALTIVGALILWRLIK